MVDPAAKLTQDMLATIGRTYLQNVYHIQNMSTMDNVTANDVRIEMMKGEITGELCLQLFDSIIMNRYDYMVRSAVIDKIRHPLLRVRTAALEQAERYEQSPGDLGDFEEIVAAIDREINSSK